ncbi:Mlf [Symbiodinium necroappetens]|uniref:Mlf protein n=1 Tax=Symbiodinium necroappetens TaxID=1628268 RepID=A0A813BPA4_9DINO|nr:Mlf [Symbiodinium necroappetens]
MATFLPGAFGPGAAPVGSEPFSQALQVHRDCAERCASEGIAVSADSGAEKAVDTLRRCGVVQLLGAYDLTALDRFQKAFDQLKSKEKAYKKLLDTKQLHDGRYQVYLPFAKPFSSRETLGVSDLVLEVLHAYFMTSGGSFGIDHVSVLTSASGSANQSLHPDVHYFKGLSVSVHTALHDIPSSLGPTYFCPCTGESLTREDWPASAAIKMTILKRKDCLARSFAPSFTAPGTVTIYDGAMFHKVDCCREIQVFQQRGHDPFKVRLLFLQGVSRDHDVFIRPASCAIFDAEGDMLKGFPGNLQMNGSTPGAAPGTGCYSCQTFVMSSSRGVDGKVHTERYSSSDVGNAQHGIREAQHAYSNSSTAEDKMGLERHLGERARKMVKERNRFTQDERCHEMLRGMDEGGRDHFDRDFGGETGKSCSVSNKETTDIGCAFLGWTAGQKLRGAA